MKCLRFLPLVILALSLVSMTTVSAQSVALNNAADATLALLHASDRPALTFALPSWQDVVESRLASVIPADLSGWRPDSLVCIHAGDAIVWASLWQAGRDTWLIWVAATTNDDALSVMAFADEIGNVASQDIHVVASSENGLHGIAVVAEGPDSYIYDVPDVLVRMHLRTMTDIGYSEEQKAQAEAGLRASLDANAAVLCRDDLTGWPELMVADCPDNRLRTVTFLVANKNFSSHCGGWVIFRNKKGRPERFESLVDATPSIGQPEQAILSPGAWYGALYTRVIPCRFNKKDYFLLEGFKGADALVKRRVLDVVSVENGTVTFGAKVFIHPKESYRRRVFVYSSRASMSMMYEEKSHMLVMDHLEPSDPILTGQFAFYGPDLSYDAYLLTDDGLKFQNDIQITVENGAVPNPEAQETASDKLSQPGSGSRRQNTGASSSWGHGSSRQNSGSGKSNSWFDKGKGNSAPNVRRR